MIMLSRQKPLLLKLLKPLPGTILFTSYRKCGITGTDAGAILGLNPYRSAFQVYHDKISDTIENIDNEAMRQGRDLEDYVAQRFSEETGFKVRRANAIYQSEEHPLLLADFDRLIVGQRAGLECKTVSPFSADKWTDGKIPAHYMAQVNHYLAVSGFDCWYVAALIFGRELVIHKIVTDKQVLSDLIDKEELFWTNHVVPQVPPAPNGCDCDTQQINQLYEVDNRDKTADLSALHGLLDKRQELSDQIEQMEQRKRLSSNRSSCKCRMPPMAQHRVIRCRGYPPKASVWIPNACGKSSRTFSTNTAKV